MHEDAIQSRVARYFPVFTCIACALILAGFGLVCLFSALRGSLVVPTNLLNKQAILLVAAVAVGATAATAKESWLQKYALLAAVLALVGLLVVLVPGIGVKVNGARRWLNFGFTHFQVSEIAKVLFVIAFAHYLSARRLQHRHFFWGGILPLGMLSVPVLLLLAEPDYGTAALFAMVGLTLLFLWGSPLWVLIPSLTTGASAFFWLIHQDPVRWKRLTTFLDIEANKADGTYQLYQGLLAFGAGGWTGVGLGNGRQQLAYLPEAHTDFILPVIAEELGLVATLGVLLLYGGIFLAMIQMARRATSLFWFLVFTGGGCFLVYQALFNMGVVTALLPTKGISLPFISYGGANLVGSFCFLGLMVAGWRQRYEPLQHEAREI
jgi:cell division protein FtsW